MRRAAAGGSVGEIEVLRKNKDELFIRYWQKQYQTYLKIMKDLPSNHPRYLELEKQKQLIEGELNESL